MQLKHIHHIALICSDLERSLSFYVDLLGFKIEHTIYREERDSHKVDLSLNGVYMLELFTFPNAPQRPTRPEAQGLRHIAFSVEDVFAWREYLLMQHYPSEEIRVDEYTGKRFFFISDPDHLPIEFYES